MDATLGFLRVVLFIALGVPLLVAFLVCAAATAVVLVALVAVIVLTGLQ